jgi:hypothetical protein
MGTLGCRLAEEEMHPRPECTPSDSGADTPITPELSPRGYRLMQGQNQPKLVERNKMGVFAMRGVS